MRWYDGNISVIDIERVNDNTRKFFVKLIDIDDDDNKLEFVPGQFVELTLPIHTDIKKCTRHYSIASLPNVDVLEFIINKVNGGAGTEYLFSNDVVPGETKWQMVAPLGQFVLPKILNKNTYFICTGTGVAPFKSMIFDLFYNKKESIIDKNIIVIFGCREEKDILYNKEFTLLKENNSNFEYNVTLSREKTNNYSFGYVQDIIDSLYKNKDFNNSDFFICGTSNMVIDVKNNLLNKNIRLENIHLEIYV